MLVNYIHLLILMKISYNYTINLCIGFLISVIFVFDTISRFLIIFFPFLRAVREGSMSNKQKNGGTITKIGCIGDTVYHLFRMKLLVHLPPHLMLKKMARRHILKLLSNDLDWKHQQSTECN
jgi:hypothetical protein